MNDTLNLLLGVSSLIIFKFQREKSVQGHATNERVVKSEILITITKTEIVEQKCYD